MIRKAEKNDLSAILKLHSELNLPGEKAVSLKKAKVISHELYPIQITIYTFTLKQGKSLVLLLC
jgi:hypothetical protein